MQGIRGTLAGVPNLTPFSSYGRDLPARLPRTFGAYLASISDALEIDAPPTVSSVVALDYKLGIRTPDSLILTSFGTYRRHYTCVDRLSKVLAPFYMQHNVVPIIRPVLAKELLLHIQHDSAFVRRLKRKGILIYSRRQ